MVIVSKAPPGVTYPDADGQPVAESGFHARALMGLVGVLQVHFRHLDDVLVGGNQFLYHEEGNPLRVVSPDVYVARGVVDGRTPRRSYQVWVEGKVPDFVLEVTSRKTRRQDLGPKRELYARLGVREYVLFDPLSEYLHPPLQAFQLVDGTYARVELWEGVVFRSAVLGLNLWAEGLRVRALDPRTGERLLYPEEQGDLVEAETAARKAVEQALRAEIAARAAAEQATQAEAVARRYAEAEVARLQAELERLRGVSGT